MNVQYTSEDTRQILLDQTSTASLSALEYYALAGANFSEDETCTVLANFIEENYNLEYLGIMNQDWTRPIKVETVEAT